MYVILYQIKRWMKLKFCWRLHIKLAQRVTHRIIELMPGEPGTNDRSRVQWRCQKCNHTFEVKVNRYVIPN